MINIILANPRGFCAGVERAITIVEKAIEKYGKPIYVRHEIVHNKYVVNELKEKGAIFVEKLSEVPDDAMVIFSAHGVPQKVYEIAGNRNLYFIDATCPLVRKVHFSVTRFHKKNIKTILIGHKGHPEVIGTMGQLPKGNVILVENIEDVKALNFSQEEHLAFTTQTTLSAFETKDIIDALKRKYPKIEGLENGDLCYATTNRQLAVLELTKQIDLLLVVGSNNSSNSKRLVELAQSKDISAYLLDNINDIKMNWFENIKNIGISSGASAPEYLVQELINWLKEHLSIGEVINVNTAEENMRFPIPLDLKSKKKATKYGLLS